jgi:hypothetical protein
MSYGKETAIIFAKWRVFTTLTERLQWILPWVRWKQICCVTLRKSWDANRLSGSQEIPPKLCNLKFYYSNYKCPPSVTIQRQINKGHVLTFQISQLSCKYYIPIYVWVLKEVEFTSNCTKIITTFELFPVKSPTKFTMLWSMIGGTNCTADHLQEWSVLRTWMW